MQLNLEKRKQKRMGSAFTDWRDGVESKIGISTSDAIGNALTPSKPGTLPPSASSSAMRIFGLSVPVLAVGGLLLYKFFGKKKR